MLWSINNIPFLSRPFHFVKARPEYHQISLWVIEQLPPDLSADGRWLDASLTAVQRADPERVARFCLEMVEKAYKPDLKVDGPLSEFLGITDDAGRRPRGLNTAASGSNAGGKGSGKSGKSGKAKSVSDKPRATECSNAQTARGKTCNFRHPAPCYRDNLWAGLIPKKMGTTSR